MHCLPNMNCAEHQFPSSATNDSDSSDSCNSVSKPPRRGDSTRRIAESSSDSNSESADELDSTFTVDSDSADDSSDTEEQNSNAPTTEGQATQPDAAANSRVNKRDSVYYCRFKAGVILTLKELRSRTKGYVCVAIGFIPIGATTEVPFGKEKPFTLASC